MKNVQRHQYFKCLSKDLTLIQDICAQSIQIYLILLRMKVEIPQLKFKETYSLQKRCTMVANLKKKQKNSILAIIQKDERCTKYPHLTSKMFIISRDQTRIGIYTQLRKRLTDLMNRTLEKQSLFMYTSKTILSRDEKFDVIYEKYKDPEDGVLYLKYSSIDPF